MDKKKAGAAAAAALLIGLAAVAALQPWEKKPLPTAANTQNSQAPSAVDVSFAQMMVAHHKQAIEMAELAPKRAARAEVKSLAAGIIKEQEAEIALMSGWLRDWNEPVDIPTAADPGMGGHDMGAHVSGMMSHEDMTRLKSLSGARFDQAFLEMMITHHEGALEMARTQQQIGQYGPSKELAARIIKDQTEEIARMRSLLKA